MIKFPFTSLQQFNLDWIMQQLHKILDFMPLNGVAGDVLQRTVDGAAWQPIAAVSMDIHSLNASSPDGADEIPIYDNDLAGNYKVTVQDVLDLVPPAPVDSVNGKIGTVVLDKDDIGLDNVDNVQQYSASNPPPYPVTSVNGQTGDVTVTGGVSSVNGQTGAVTLTIPTDTSDLTNNAGFVDAAGAAAAAPVQSVNGQTGAVIVGSGSMLFGAETQLTLTAPPDINKITDEVFAQKTSDGKFLRIHGIIRTYAAETAGWYDLTASGMTVASPASEITLNGVGIWLDENKAIGYDEPAFIRIKIDTSGNISIGLMYKYSLGPNNKLYNYLIYPFIIPIA